MTDYHDTMSNKRKYLTRPRLRHAGMTGYPCCEQPTGTPIHNGYIHPVYKVARHICWTIMWDCDECGESYVTDWDELPEGCCQRGGDDD